MADSSELPLAERRKHTLQRALEIAHENGQDVVGTEHVVLAFLDDPGGIAGMTLHSVRNANALRAEVVRIITSDGYKTPSWTIDRSETQ